MYARQLQFDSISAGYIDPADYQWHEYTGRTAMRFEHPNRKRNRKHDLVLTKGDVFGLREKRTGGWNLVKADLMHVVFKMTDDDMDLIFDRSKIARRVPKKQTGTPGRTRTKTGTVGTRFKKRGVSATREKTQINRADYQWRAVINDSPIEVRTPANKPKFELKKGQIVGLRFVNAAKGGFIVLENGIKSRVSTRSYDDISIGSYVLDKQPKGTIDIDSEELRKEKIRAEKAKKEELTKKRSVRIPKAKTKEGTGRKSKINRRPAGTKAEDRDVPVEDTVIEVGTPERKSSVIRRRRRFKPGTGDTKKIDQETRLEEAFKDTVKSDMDDLDDKAMPTRLRRKRGKIRPSQVAKETAVEDKKQKKAVKEEIKEVVKEANDFDPGDVVVFNKDKKQREYVVLEERPSEKSDNITEYLIYNLTDEPDYIQKFMQNKRGTKLSTLGKRVRNIKDMDEYEEYVDMFDVSTLSPYK